MKASRSLWRLAFRNLLRNRRRSLATGLAISFGFVGLVLLSAYIYRSAMGLRAASVYLNQKSHVAIFKKGALEGFASKPHLFVLEPADQDQVRTSLLKWRDSIEFVGHFLNGAGLMTDGSHSVPVMISGVEPSLYARLVQHPEIRRWADDWVSPFAGFKREAMQVQPQLISITPRLRESLALDHHKPNWAAGHPGVQIVGKNYFKEMGAVDAELGLLHTTGSTFSEDSSVIAPLPLLQDLLATEGVEYIGVFLHQPLRASSIAQNLREILGSNFEVVTYTNDAWNEFYVGSMSFLYVIGEFFTILILGAVALAIVNTTTLNLLERTREIGTLRALGFAPRELKALFVRESVQLAAISVSFGLLASLAIAALVNGLDIQFRPPGAQGSVQFLLMIHPGFCALMAALTLGICLAATVFVVRRQSQTKIVQLLNETGA